VDSRHVLVEVADHPALGGAGDSGFTPNGKPAEDVIRRQYKLLVP
jgi:hypothetical protein